MSAMTTTMICSAQPGTSFIMILCCITPWYDEDDEDTTHIQMENLEIEFEIREVGVILDSDPRKARAFEIEKYATYAGLSKDFIQNSIQAVNNDDWDAQKDIYREVITGLSKNPEWQVDVPSEAELRVMIAEDKAIQEATLASLNIDKINRDWSNKLAEEAKENCPISGALNCDIILKAALI